MKHHELSGLAKRIASGLLLGALLVSELAGFSVPEVQAAPAAIKSYTAVFTEGEGLDRTVSVKGVSGTALTKLADNLSEYLEAEASAIEAVQFAVSDGKSHTKIETELSGVQASDKMHLYKQSGSSFTEWEFSVAKDGAVWSKFDLPGVYVFTETGMAGSGKDGVTVLDSKDDVTVLDSKDDVTVLDSKDDVTVLDSKDDVTVLEEDGVGAASDDAAFLDAGISAQSDGTSVHADHVPITDLSIPAYAAVYADGYMVFQRGNDFSEMIAAHGEIVGGPWTGFEDTTVFDVQHSWYSFIKSNVVVVNFLDKIYPKSVSHWFGGTNSSVKPVIRNVIGGSNLDLSRCQYANEMFYECVYLESIDDVSNWNLSSVVSTSNMFRDCNRLKFLDVSNWGMDSCDNFTYMFSGDHNLNLIGINKWNFFSGTNYDKYSRPGRVDETNHMFDGMTCDLDLSGLCLWMWDWPFNTDFSYAFKSIDFSDCIIEDPGGQLYLPARHIDMTNTVFNKGKGGYADIEVNLVENNNIIMSSLESITIGTTKNIMDSYTALIVRNMLSGFTPSSFWRSENDGKVYTAYEIYERHNGKILLDTYYPVYDCISLNDGTLFVGQSVNIVKEYADEHNVRITRMERLVTQDEGYATYSYYKMRHAKNIVFTGDVLVSCKNSSRNKSAFFVIGSSSDISIPKIDFSSLKSYVSATDYDAPLIFKVGKKYNDEKFPFIDMLLLNNNVSQDVLFKLLTNAVTDRPNVSYVCIESDKVYKFSDLLNNYDPNTMAGTYVRLQDISFDPVMSKAGGVQKIDGYLEMVPDELPEPEAIPTGWKFVGWFTEREGGTQLKPGDKITQTTYYAHWQDYTYDLVLKPNGADGEDIRQIGLEYHKAHKLPGAVYQYEGKVFKGWNTRKDGSGTHYEPNDYITGMTEVDGGTVTLYAEWEDEPEYVTITFISNIEGMPVPDPIQVEKGKDFSGDRLPKLVYDGYTLWNWEFEFNGSWYTSTSIAGSNLKQDRVVRYNWYKNPTITFHASPEAEDMVIVIPYYSKLSVGQIPSYPQTADRTVRMMGWYKDEALTNAGVDVTSAITKDTHYYAKWGYKPVWNANGGQITSDLSMYGYQAGSQYVIESLPEAYFTGRNLDGWFLEDGTEVHAGDTVDLTVFPKITARWTQKETVTITFDKNGAYNYSGNLTPVVYKGDPVEFPVIVQGPRSYVSGAYRYAPFLGWADADGNFHQSGEVFLEDMTLTAQFGTLDCTLTFDAQGGSTPAGLDVSSGKMVVASGSTLSSLPGSKKEQYILDGWYSEINGGGTKLTTDTVVTESGTWYANWKPFLVSEAGDTSYYTFGAEWSNASNTSVTNAEDRLDWHVSSTSSVSSSLHLWFELSKDAVADGKVIPVGAVKIRIPKYIWKDWNGNNTGGNNVSSQFVKYPATKSGMWFSYMEDGDDYVIVNSKELSGSAGLSATINYSVSPANVPGGAWDRMYVEKDLPYADMEVPVEFTVDSDGDGVLEVDQSKTLHAEMHHILGETASMSYYNMSYTAPSGTSMYGKEDANQYFYVQWRVSRSDYNGLQSASHIYKADGYSDGLDISTPEAGISVGSYYYLYTKHPISLLANAPAEGVKLSNYGTVYTAFQSGYELNIPVMASTTIYAPKYPVGQYTKKQDWNSGDSSYTINGGQEDILDDGDEVRMPYTLKWNGEAPVDPVWNEDKGTYEVPRYTMIFEDGLPGDVLYSSGSVSAKYVWEPVCGNITLEEEDYYFCEFKLNMDGYDANKTDGVWKESLSGSKIPTRLYVRRRGCSEYELVYSDFSISGHVNSALCANSIISEDIVGFKLEVDSAFYRENVHLDVMLVLKPTNHVKQLLQADVDQKASSIIKNGARCTAYLTALGDTEEGRFFYAYDNTGGNNAANKNCYELNVSRTTQYTKKYAGRESSTVFDVERGTQDTPMGITSYNYNNSSRKKKLTAGTFYDLLPAGTSVDPSGVCGQFLTGNNSSSFSVSADNYNIIKKAFDDGDFNSIYRIISQELYNVSFIHNYQNSGRTMMVIDYTAPEDGNVYTGVVFYYLLHNTYENVMEHGTNMENDVAFVDRTKDKTPLWNKFGALSTITEKQYFQSLEDAYSTDISYARANTNYIPVDAVSWGFDKTVQTVSEYLHADECLLNDQYRYRLTYSQSAYADSSSLVFFDVLEDGAEVKGEDGSLQQLNSAWHGTLEYVDVSSAANKLTKDSTTVHCAPVIYYSTKPRDQFTGVDYTLENTATWSSTKPADLSTVTAIAVDCRKNTDGTDFVMHGQESLEIIVHMRAPKDSAYAGRAAYNTGIVRASHDGAEPTDQYSDAEVTLKEEDPELHKTSDPASGTQERPADVFQDDVLTYTLSVANNGELTAKDIVLSDVIPEGLSVRTEEVRIHFGDPSKAVAANVSPRLHFTRDGQALSFMVRTLLPGETVYIQVPCTVLVMEGVLENTAHLISVNGVEKEIDSETTWHEAQPATMAVFKKGYGDTGVVGAKMQLIAEDGTVAHEWVTDGRTESFIVPAGTYTVHEVEAPAGYFPAEDIEVVLDRQGYRYVNGQKVGAVEMQDDYTKVSVLKQDEEGNPLSGAVLAVYEIPEGYTEDGVSELVTVSYFDGYNSIPMKEVTVDVSELNDTLLLELAPDPPFREGYRFDRWHWDGQAIDGKVSVNAVWTPDTPEIPDPGPDPVPVSYAMPGAGLTGIVADAAAGKLGEPVKRWTSTSEAEPLYGLLAQGKEYVLVEESVPSDDYRLADPVRFTVAEDGSEQRIIMEDPYSGYTFDVYKYGGVKGNVLSGAKLSIYPVGWREHDDSLELIGDAEDGSASQENAASGQGGQFPVSWTSGEEPQSIRLQAGSYILHEEEAPEGYRKHADIPFTVLQNGKVLYEQEGFIEDSIYMVDEPDCVEIGITKEVEGNMASRIKAFDFVLLIGRESSDAADSITLQRFLEAYSGSDTEDIVLSYDEELGGYVYPFTLRDGGEALFKIPSGRRYAFAERNAYRSGYTLAITPLGKTVSSVEPVYTLRDEMGEEKGDFDGMVTCVAQDFALYLFTNTKNVGVATGFSGMTGVAAGIGALALAGVTTLLVRWHRRRQKARKMLEAPLDEKE